MLKRGNFGPSVRTLQKKLNRLHFKVGRGLATGYFGWKTDDAVRRLQCAYGLKLDGLVGPKTKAALAENGQLSPNFHVDEFCSKGNGDLKLNGELIMRLERLRKELKSPIHITSGYRDSWYNRKVGGARNSMHLQGRAADITSPNRSVVEMAVAADKVGFNGIGKYHRQGFVHVDVRGWRARW